MEIELTVMFVYRFLALVVAGMMVWVAIRENNWQHQLFAAMIFVPFILRAAGMK